MVSNALSASWLLAGLRGSFELMTTAPAAPEPALRPGEVPVTHPASLALLAVGLCVLAVGIGLWLARPNRLSLRDAPARSNRLHVLHVVGLLAAMWFASGLAMVALRELVLDGMADGAPTKAMKVRCELASGAIAALVWLVAGLAVAWHAFRERMRGLGLSLRRPLRDGARAVVTYLMVFPVCTALHIGCSLLLSVLGVEPRIHPVLHHFSTFPLLWKQLAIVSVLVLAPLAEEVFFRGLVQSLARRAGAGPWTAILAASALFAAVHYNQPQAIPSLFVLSLALGYSYERTGRLVSPILLHSLFNAVYVLLSAMVGDPPGGTGG